MFASALKSISSTNITSNYTVSSASTSTAGPWKIYDAKKKSTGKAYSVFVFDKKSLDPQHGGGSLGRSSAAAHKRAGEEVVERLKKEALALAKLRHPSVLELVEPVEETRGGGLQFVTEAVTASLASLLQEKDDQEGSGGVGGRSSRYVTEDADGTRRRRDLEIDELEIQKGLLQISKALEFLHENAGLVHGNLTPDAILINAKSDWKISGLSFCSPPENSSKPTSFQPISLSEVLSPDPRLPRFVQINLDYTSPDFVIDNNLSTSSDMFSLGLLCVALYNSPHRSPIECHSSPSAYKRLFTASSSVPTTSNNFCSSRPLPRELSHHVLPRLIARRPAQRMTAREFQNSEYFDNILVSTIRFLDAFPAKTANEKAQFMRGLNRVLPSFPKSVMEKKLLPALMEEMKDRDLLSLILQNVFKIVDLLPSARRAFGDKVRPRLKEIFVTNVKNAQEKDPTRDAGVMVVLERLSTIANNCGGKEFKDDILPIVGTALESPTPAVVDAALRSLNVMLPVLDFSTIKNELFPVITTIFSRTTSLAIKVRGLQAFVVLCGGTNDPADGMNGPATTTTTSSTTSSTSSSSILDKYTMQEKVVPLVKVIKTKEPAVMMAALKVLRVVGQVADADFVAMEILPILWSMSLGPLLDLQQFRAFMDLIRSLSGRVEDEQTRKLQELSGGGATNGGASSHEDIMSFGGVPGFESVNGSAGGADDFEMLVKGKTTATTATASSTDAASGWDALSGLGSNATSPGFRAASSSSATAAAAGAAARSPGAPTFSWSTTSPAPSQSQIGGVKAQQASPFRTVTPDFAGFHTLGAASSSSQQQQPSQATPSTSASIHSVFGGTSSGAPAPASASTSTAASTSLGWGTGATTPNPWASASTPSYTPSAAATTTTANPLSSFGSGGLGSSMSSLSLGGAGTMQRPAMGQQQRPSSSAASSFSLPPPPSAGAAAGGFGSGSGLSGFSLAPPPSAPSQAQTAPKYGGGLASLASAATAATAATPSGGLMGGQGMAAMGMAAAANRASSGMGGGGIGGILMSSTAGGAGVAANNNNGGMMGSMMGSAMSGMSGMSGMNSSTNGGTGMGMGMGMGMLGMMGGMQQQQQQKQQHQQHQQQQSQSSAPWPGF